ncbi:MAG TPA: hypothetical protein DF383_03955 [Deltaproteobacteria bacterium]|nr:hypothetical protein [Deltaproteobacteria bacterium]
MLSWPAIPYPEWEDTCSTLHLWTQIVGKVRLALAPWVNHSWHVVFYLTARGLTTSPIPYRGGAFQIDFDFISHELKIATSSGALKLLPLRPQSVADFYAEFMVALHELGIEVEIGTTPNEIPDPIPFPEDRVHGSYDAEAAQRFWRALLASHQVLTEFRSGFIGKVSPVHFFWGSFDLAVTRFSGRRAPLHPGGTPGLPDVVTREAYSHECSSAGFWPGNGGLGYPAFYSYAYAEPKGYSAFPVSPAEAVYNPDMKLFLLPYETLRTAADPQTTLLTFLESTYRAAAESGGWDRAALECVRGRADVPRPLERSL